MSLETPAAVTAFRARFPIFRERIHLASNSMGAVSDAVIEAHQVYLDERLQHGASWKFALPRHEALREQFAALIGARPHEIAICCSATQALGVIASCFEWRERPGIVFDDYSFPSVTYLWRAQQLRGAKVTQVPVGSSGQLDPSDFDSAIDSQTQLVSVSHVCYKNGHRLDIGSLAERAHAAGALFMVDDYQACGSRKLDVKALDVDVLVSGTSKFLLGSPGLGLMYVREDLFERLHPTVTGWFGQEDPMEFQIERHDEARDARRFQTGTPAFSSVYDSLAAIRLLSDVGLDKVEAWIDRLTAELMRRMRERGIKSPTPIEAGRRGAQVTITSVDAPAAVAELARRGIICSHRNGNIRTAWHYYNTLADVDALIGALDEIPQFIGGTR